MTDTYQAVYDAVRSKLGHCDIAGAAAEAFSLQIQGLSFAIEGIRYEIVSTISMYQEPSAIYRPVLSKDGDQWCALYGEDLQMGCAGFGDTPEKAMAAFDKAWRSA